MFKRVHVILIALLVAPTTIANQSITYTQETPIESRSIEEVMMLARERAIEYAMDELPALVMGQERLENDSYSRVIENWQLAGLRHEFVSTKIDHDSGVAQLTSVIHYDKDEVVQALVEVSSAKRLAKEAAEVYGSVRDIDADTLSDYFLRRADAAYESVNSQTYSNNDERLIKTRLAQERVLAEAMKDVYLHYITPAIKALRASDISIRTGRTSLRDDDGNRRNTTILTYSPRLKPVNGVDPSSQGVITWDMELNAILAPYQERYPFINIPTIIERMSVCSSTGDVLIHGSPDVKPGYISSGPGNLRPYHDGYNTTLRYLRPSYNSETMRREEATLVIANYGNMGGHDSDLAQYRVTISLELRRAFGLEHGFGKDGNGVADYYYHKDGESIGVCIH